MKSKSIKRAMIDAVINRNLSKTDNLCNVCARREKCSQIRDGQRTLWCIEFQEERL